MQADADAQRLLEVARHRLVEVVEGERHAPRRVERLAAGDPGLLFEAEDRHHAVADELVDPAAGRLDGLAGRAEIAVEQEHHVVGQLALRDRGEAADVGEQDCDVVLAAMGLRLAAIGLDRAGRRRQERRHAVVAGWRVKLAGEPHIGRARRPSSAPSVLPARAAAAWRDARRRCEPGRSSSGRGRRTPRHAGCRQDGSSPGS